MLGAVVGDIIGSTYEYSGNKEKYFFPLFHPHSFFTDDSVLTLAVADGLMKGGTENDFAQALHDWGRRYPDAGYGSSFLSWLEDEMPLAYNSFGNGSAMRVSPVAWFYDTLEEVEEAALRTAIVSHSHPEGIKGAQATAAAIFLARTGKEKLDIAQYITDQYGYDLSPTCDDIRPLYHFDVTCQGTVPQAIIAWLDSDCFEDAIRNAISLGGDADTLAAITGAIAQADYGIPPLIAAEAFRRLDAPLRDVLLRFERQVMAGKV